MRTLLFILQKEFTQIRRNRMMLPIIFVVPLVQLLILVNAANMEMKHIKICIVDNDLSSSSRLLTGKFSNSKFFTVTGNTFNMEDATRQVENGRAEMILNIPSGFERTLVRENKSNIQMLFNAINGTVAGISNAYASQILAAGNREIISRWYGVTKMQDGAGAINVIPSFWYNPDMNYKIFMVPAILVLLVTIIGMMLAALNIVREKEMGNIEQINVTPIRKIHFIIGKLLPFWIIALVMLAFGLLLGKIIYDIPIVGNLGLLFAVAGIYLLAMQGFGLMVSNSAATQQQAMFAIFFFILIFIMMSGIFTPTDSMPQWAQIINYANPVAYFMRIIRMILLKGSGFSDILRDFIILSCYSIAVITVAVFRYRKVS
ncbi:MAG TPA: ABC transporter permease [Bacteroidales bacterium]|nr:ABC transporter permease [Bacteroidales bacterium]